MRALWCMCVARVGTVRREVHGAACGVYAVPQCHIISSQLEALINGLSSDITTVLRMTSLALT